MSVRRFASRFRVPRQVAPPAKRPNLKFLFAWMALQPKRNVTRAACRMPLGRPADSFEPARAV